MTSAKYRVITIAIAALIISMTLGAVTIQSIQTIKAQPRPTQLPVLPQAPENHLPVQTVQDDTHIVTTVTKSGEPPQGPVVIIPPGPEGGHNGTILTPGENITNENPGNITVITPGGNVTEIPNGNITNVGNDTVIITEPGRNITETPANVTVIDPPHPVQLPANTTGSPCTCNQSQPGQTIPPVTITPAPGQNVTTLPPVVENVTNQPPPFPPTNNTSGNQSGGSQPPANPATGNETNPAGNQTGNTGGNATQTNPATNSTNSTTTTTPVSQYSPFLPGLHINSVSYNGANSNWLHR